MIRTRREPLKRRTLNDIFAEEDHLGLLDVTPKRAGGATADQRLLASLRMVEAFIGQHGREPDSEANNLTEASLAVQLTALRGNSEHVASLTEFDTLGLLEAHPQPLEELHHALTEAPSNNASEPSIESRSFKAASETVTSLDDIWASDELGLLSDEEGAASIFVITHVPEMHDRDIPDSIAQRTQCDDFYRYEVLFHQVREELQKSVAEVVRFQKESQIDKGDMFIVNGMFCLVDEVGDDEGEKGRYNPRLRVIFDNGTESNLLLRSLARALYKDEVGRRVLRRDATFDAMQGITHHDKRTGVIYILRSLSTDPALKSIRHLHKIGYTEKNLEARLAGAEKQQTYLEAPVKVVTSFDCYNLDPHRFEHLVHAMLHHQRVNAALHSRDGSIYRPREWFNVELETAREVVKRIVDGTIAQYRMDNTVGRLVSKR